MCRVLVFRMFHAPLVTWPHYQAPLLVEWQTLDISPTRPLVHTKNFHAHWVRGLLVVLLSAHRLCQDIIQMGQLGRPDKCPAQLEPFPILLAWLYVWLAHQDWDLPSGRQFVF